MESFRDALVVMIPFVTGSLVTLSGLALTEWFRRKARKEPYAEKLFELKTAAYSEIATALYKLTPESDSAVVRSAIERALPFISDPVLDVLNHFLAVFEGHAYYVIDLERTPLAEFEEKVHALKTLGDLLNAMRRDLGLNEIAATYQKVVHKEHNGEDDQGSERS